MDKIVIGAPNYPGGGAVFECHLPPNYYGGSVAPDRLSACTRLFEEQKYETNASYDSSNEQLGSSILVTKKGDTIACAPRFKINLKCTKKEKSTSCDVIESNTDVEDGSDINYAMPGRCLINRIQKQSNQSKSSEFKPYSNEKSEIGNGIGSQNMFSFAGSGNIAFARNTAFITTPGRDYGQGGVFGRKLNNRSLGFATKNFENPAFHRKLKNNKAYTKESD